MSKEDGAPSGAPLARVSGATPLEAALVYALELGWPVFPTEPKGKAPLTQHGLHDATTDEGQIRKWWSRWTAANVALASGAASGVVVIDADGEEGIGNAKELLGEDALTVLQSVTGGGGRHFFFAHPGSGHRVRTAPAGSPPASTSEATVASSCFPRRARRAPTAL